ncbi:MAG: hypothetical protein Q8L47_00380 [bacterium]|nr:hypothetical protein [bacterium]
MNYFKDKTFLIIGLVVFIITNLSLYFFNYSKSDGMPLGAVESSVYQAPKFDPSLLTWTLATSSAEWETRDSAVSFVFQNKMWTMGGLDANKVIDKNYNVKYWEAPHFNDIWTSEDGVNWQEVKTHAEWAERRSMSVVVFQDKLWMFGGWSTISGYTSDIWNSTDGITWTKVVANAAWPAREGQTAEVFQGKIWFMGGVNYDKRQTFNDVWWSDNGTEWNKATTTIPWSSRWDHATAVYKGKIYLSGGMNIKKETFKDVWSSSDGLNWELVNANPPWQDRQGHSMVVLRDKMWIVGRLNDLEGKGVNDIWYTDDGLNWQKTQTDPPWLGREDHSVLIFKDRIFVFGGMDANWKWRNDVWYSSN